MKRNIAHTWHTCLSVVETVKRPTIYNTLYIYVIVVFFLPFTLCHTHYKIYTFNTYNFHKRELRDNYQGFSWTVQTSYPSYNHVITINSDLYTFFFSDTQYEMFVIATINSWITKVTLCIIAWRRTAIFRKQIATCFVRPGANKNRFATSCTPHAAYILLAHEQCCKNV